MKWIPTDDGAVNARYIVKVVSGADGTVLHLVDGSTARSSLVFDVVDGELIPIEPVNDDDGDCPF